MFNLVKKNFIKKIKLTFLPQRQNWAYLIVKVFFKSKLSRLLKGKIKRMVKEKQGKSTLQVKKNAFGYR